MICSISTKSNASPFDVSFEELGDIVTSVSKKPESSFNSAAAIYAVTNEDIKQSGATNVAEVLRIVPGLQVSRVDSANWAITSRGFNDGFGNKLLVMIDGRSVYTPLFSGVYWDTQDTMLEDIERIEVIRGSGGTLWGANAVNGIINIITKKSSDTQGTVVNTGYGNEENFVEGRYGGNIDNKIFYRNYVKLFNKDSSKKIDRSDGGNEWSGVRSGFRIDSDHKNNHKFTIQGDIYNQDVDLELNVPSNSSPYILSTNDTIEQFGANIIGRWDHAYSDKTKNSFQIYYDHTSRQYSVLEQNISTIDIDFQSQINLNKKNELIWGFDYRYIWDDLIGSESLSFRTENRYSSLYSMFIQNEYSIIDNKLNLIIGSKFEHNDYTGFEFQPNIRSAWSIDSNNTLWAAISRAVRTPSRFEDDISILILGSPSGSINGYGNQDIKSEDLISYEIGYRKRANKNLLLDTTLFLNDYRNLVTNEMSFTPTGIALIGDNKAKAKSYGFELATTWDINDYWTLKSGYSYINIDVSTDIDSNDTLIANNENIAPHHQFNIRSLLYLPNNIEINNSLYYVDGIASGDIDSYFRFDSRIGWKPVDNIELSLVGTNLLDDRHQEFTAPLTGAANEIERSFYAKLTWRY